jgi:hypothetical protein
MWAENHILPSIIKDHSQKEIILRKENVHIKVDKEEKEDGYVFQIQGDTKY